jgi:hypothetical protein
MEVDRPILIGHSAADREIMYGREQESGQQIVNEENKRVFKAISDKKERSRFKKNKTSSFSAKTLGDNDNKAAKDWK